MLIFRKQNNNMMKTDLGYLEHWSRKYYLELTSNIFPFWLKYGLDKKNGGFYTCIDRDGTLMDTTKSVWFQGRAAFIYAYAYNNIDKNIEWLEASESAINFLENHCFDSDGRMFFEVSREGKPLRKRRYLFSEAFAAIAMSEYSIASGNKTYAKKALELFKLILQYKNTPDLLPSKYTRNMQTRGHSLPMILINTASRIREAIQDDVLTQQIDESIFEIQHYFMHEEFHAVLETVGVNGEFINTNMGRTINPGHSIETAWFILEEAKYRNWDENLTQLGLKILDWSWDWGWDKKHGGIINFRDCCHLSPQDYAHDMKFWWPQTEAIIATLYAYMATKDEKYFDMYKHINNYTFRHFPDKEYGEWFGYLHRNGTISQPAKGNLFKGPFHIPRMLIKSHLLCNSILHSETIMKQLTNKIIAL